VYKLFALLFSLACIICARSGTIAVAARPPLTFDHDVAPIVFQYCAECHRPGESTPFSLLTYKDVRTHARQIAAVTRSRYMPPWLPIRGPLPFAAEMRLSDAQIAVFQKWIDDGLLEGKPADLPSAPHFTPGWQLGPPDLVIQAQKPVPANRIGPRYVLELRFAGSR